MAFTEGSLEETICYCEGEKCNGATSMKTSVVVGVVAFASLVALAFRM